VLRAPTADSGLAPHCRDTFFGGARLRVWRTGATGSSSSGSGSRSGGGSWGGSSGGQAGPLPAGVPLVDAASSTAALEVGGGPWWAPWRAKAAMLEPFRSLVQLPIDAGALSRAVPDILKPPGL
jgi:tocopherol cyclase